MNIKIIRACWLSFGLLAGLLSPHTELVAQTKSVSILSYQKDESSEEIVEGIRDVLKSAGFREGRNLKLRVMEAQGEPERAQQLALDLIRGRPDVIATVSLPATQAVTSQTTQIPVVFAGITDPVGSEIIVRPGPTGTNLTGVSDALPVRQRIALIKQLFPKARRIGVFYNPTDANSVAQIREFQESLSESGLIAIELTVLRPRDVGSAARSLIEKVDVFQTLTDQTVRKGYATLVQVANDARIPLLGWNVVDVQAGAVATVDITDKDVGAATGRLILRVLRGTKPGSVAPEIIAYPPIYVNLNAATKQAVVFSPETKKIARPLGQ